MESRTMADATRNNTVCNIQNELPLRRGSATNLPRESRMLLDDVIEHRCPDLVVPLQRAGEVNASMANQTKEPKRVKTLWVYEKAAGGQVGRQADCRRASRQIDRKTYWQDDRQASKQARHGKRDGPQDQLPHSHVWHPSSKRHAKTTRCRSGGKG